MRTVAMLLCVLAALGPRVAFSQAVGDYGSAGPGDWGTTGANWVVCQSAGTWAGATAAPGAPTSSTNVWIRTGHTVNMEASTKNCLNLTVESGATLSSDVALPSGSIRYLRVYGTTATINGLFGSASAPGNVAALEAATTGGTLTIGGSGTFGPSRVRVNSAASGATIVFNINTSFWYTGSGGTGGVGLYPQTDNNIFTVNAGRTLTFADNSGLAVASGNGQSGAVNFTLNVSGTVNLSQLNSPLTLKVGTGNIAVLNIATGGSITVGGNVYASTVADGGTTTMSVNGTLTAGGEVDFSNPALVVSGTGAFTLPSAANLVIGHVQGIAASGGTGQIQTTTRSFNAGATYSYAGTGAQVTGTGLPTAVAGLTINNSAGVTLGASTTVNGTLTLTSGALTTGANTLSIASTGSVTRTGGHVAGLLRKYVPTGSGVARTFEIGTGADYAPVDITIANVSTAGNLSATTVSGDHPNLASGTIEPTKSVNRYWTFTNGGVVFDTYDAVFNFVSGDVDPAANPTVFIAERYSTGAWSGLVEGARTSTSTQILGATAFSDFAIGEPEGAPPAPGFELSAATMPFGGVLVGGSVTDTVFVRNIGTAALSVSSITSDNTPVYTVTPSSASVPAGDSAAVYVTFAPAAPGGASANIVFTHNAAGSPDTLAASGTGLSSAPIVSNGTGGGDWSLSATWQGGVVPGNLDSVVVLASDSVFALANADCRGIRIEAGGRVGLADTLETDHASVLGSVTVHADGRFNVITAGTFGNGSVYNHARDGGNMPVVTWGTGSTCIITGLANSSPASGSQSYYNIIWNSPNQLPNLNMGWDSITIGGDITVISTGLGRWNMTAPVAGDSATVTILGNVIVSGGAVTSNGTGNANTKITIYQYGDVTVTGGNFSVSRGSQGSGSGSTRWYLYGDSFAMSNATTQNSNPTNAWFVFAKAGTQTMTLGVGNTLTALPFQVQTGTTLNTGASSILGSGLVIVDSGATLGSGHPTGLDGTLAGTGTKTLSPAAGYTFNGAVAQTTGDLLPDTLFTLTVANAAGVSLSDSILVNGTVSVQSGDLDLNGKIITLGPSATLSETPGNTVTGATGEITTTRVLNAPVGTVNIAGLGVRIGSAANLGSTVLTRGHAGQTAGGGSVLRYFDIAPATNTGLNATLTFGYDESELNGNIEATLELYRSTDGGGSWTLAGGTVNTTANTILLTGVNELSRWTSAGSGGISVQVGAGWNMISNPLVVPNDSVTVLFPTASFPYAFAFNPASGYEQRYRMLNGVGYWEKFAASGSVDILGTPITGDTIDVLLGWNMIGSISAPVDTSLIEEVPSGIVVSQYFGYAAGYAAAASLVPGKAYWVKANAQGQLILAAGPLAEKRKGPGLLEGLSILTVTDAAGARQTLYLGAGEEFPAELFEMPPAGPAGAFDVRFSSGRMVAVKGEADMHEVAIQSASYPLVVSWTMRAGEQMVLNAGAAGERTMSGEGRLVVTSPSVRRLTISADGGNVPKEFSLGQNYPNPFNPATTVVFGLPVQSRVSIQVYNLLGQRVADVANGVFAAGRHEVLWDGTAFGGVSAGSGVYFYRIDASPIDGGKPFAEVRKMVLMK